MRTPLVMAFVLLFLGSSLKAQAPQQPVSPKLGIGLPNEPWTLAFDAAGFKVQTNSLQSDGRVYLLAENQSTEVTLSVYLQEVPGKATGDDCKESQKNRVTEKADYKRENVEIRGSSGMEIVEYTIPEFNGVPVQQ